MLLKIYWIFFIIPFSLMGRFNAFVEMEIEPDMLKTFDLLFPYASKIDKEFLDLISKERFKIPIQGTRPTPFPQNNPYIFYKYIDLDNRLRNALLLENFIKRHNLKFIKVEKLFIAKIKSILRVKRYVEVDFWGVFSEAEKIDKHEAPLEAAQEFFLILDKFGYSDVSEKNPNLCVGTDGCLIFYDTEDNTFLAKTAEQKMYCLRNAIEAINWNQDAREYLFSIIAQGVSSFHDGNITDYVEEYLAPDHINLLKIFSKYFEKVERFVEKVYREQKGYRWSK